MLQMDVDPRIIKRTQDTLGKIIRKPTLTDKLLSRPPFRFLHDIFTAVSVLLHLARTYKLIQFIKATGLMKGLFTPEELIADNVKEKESKLAFLQKVVDYLSVVHDRVIPVRIMSIIAGKEPEKTNELLCFLAEAVNKGVDNDECVRRALQNGGKVAGKKQKSRSPEIGPAVAKEKSRGEVKDKPNETQGDRESVHKREDVEEKVKRHRKTEKEKLDDKAKRSATRQKTTEDATEQAVWEKKEDDAKQKQEKWEAEKMTPDKRNESGCQSRVGPDRQSRGNSRCGSTGQEKMHEDETAKTIIPMSDSPVQPAKLVRPPSAKGSRVRKEETLVTQSVGHSIPEDHKSSETVEARLAPPRPRKSMEPGLDEPQPMSGVPGPRTTGLIIPETQQESDDDDDAQFVIEETVGGDTGLMVSESPTTQDQPSQEHGSLVNKMLQSKRELEGGSLISHSSRDTQVSICLINSYRLFSSKRSQALGNVDELTRQRERAQIEKEVAKLSATLQLLSKSAMPLGKLMDYVQEDLDSMQQEYERWTNENQVLKVRLREEESRTQAAIEPLKAQLYELQNYAVEQRKAISTFKAKILSNQDRIQDLLTKSLERVQ
ncbi:TRAF3-interacting protein 1 [Fasciolopsis buskii]|uniref:TRAF3-interacting protein 1 n=1 Tax=Fasciolopsis buskii TaxID=27845 RepID=A0A8E0S4W3_9TREM|nr:TRAF3-interacting protein 1 [Fasciolopsis buski]